MSAWQFIWKSLLHHWRINVAVTLGVMAATAVLTGALLVGDSVRGSLRSLTLNRLGRIDEVLVANRFFRAELADELSQQEGFADDFSSALPVILFPSGTVEKPGEETQRASKVFVVGSDESFWQLGNQDVRPAKIPNDEEIVLNRTLADDLGAKVGDQVALRLPNLTGVSTDSAFGDQDDQVRSIPQLTVVDIIPADSLGQFRLYPGQTTSKNAFVSLGVLQDRLEQEGRVNAIVVSSKSKVEPFDDKPSQRLASMLKPSFDDFGFSLNRVRQTFKPPEDAAEEEVFDYFQITTDQMVFPPAAELAANNAYAADSVQPVFTYLANTIAKVPRNEDDTPGRAEGIPYSLISAIDSVAGLGPLVLPDGEILKELDDDEIVLNQWTAEELKAQEGDTIVVSYFEPEATHGDAQEVSAEFTLKAIAPLTEPIEPFSRRGPPRYIERPMLVNDPQLTPEVKGFTDSATIREADPPFPFDRDRIQAADDTYWENHRTTPKAFISLSAGQNLWGSRFGQVTSYRIAAPEELPVGGDEQIQFEDRLKQELVDQLARDGERLGMQFTPVKRSQLKASAGATPFDVLFLALSFFIIAAALMLVSLLFRLGVEQRAQEIGILLAVGLVRKLVGRLQIAEGAIISAVGALFGVIVGVGYAWLMLAGLRSWWVGATVTPFLQFHWTWKSLVLGYILGELICLVTIAWSIRRLRKVAPRRLLGGQVSEGGALVRHRGWSSQIIAIVLILIALVLAAAATRLGGEAQAGAFVGAGASLLTALLLLIWSWLRSGGSAASASSLALSKMAARSAARNPSRSTLSIGLIASASFLIVALSSFRLQPTDEGKGGFDLIADSTAPISWDLNDPIVREDVLADDAGLLDGGTVLSLRLNPGDDASCSNLYRAQRPRMLGVTPRMVSYFDDPNVQHFSWAATAAETQEETANPWRLLDKPIKDKPGVVPVMIDKNTAMYSLKLYLGIGEEYEVTYEDGTKVEFQVVGLLSNSILQGSLLISESFFEETYPDIEGYRAFLVRSPPAARHTREGTLAVRRALESRLGDQGFDATETEELLKELLNVQNTYLSTFQSLGALGLLLGTFGLATVQLRSVLERRQELALLRAAGFRRSRLASMVMLENSFLLFGGLLTGILAALLAVWPHMVFGNASVPVRNLAIMLGIILVVGFISGFAAVRATLKAPLLSALRGD